MMPVLIQSQHLDRDVAHGRVLLQMIEHRPAEHIRQEDVQRHGSRPKLACQRKAFRSAHSDENLKSAVAGQVA